MDMSKFTRRTLLQGTLAAPVLGALFSIARAAATRPTDIRIEEIHYDFEDYMYRTPIKFGGTVVDRVTLFNVHVTVRTGAGKVAKGFSSMPLGNVWSFPTKTMTYEMTLKAMKTLAARIAKITGDYKSSGHPIDINCALEDEYLKAAAEVSRELKLTEPIPKLCTLVTASPVDAAIHDAFGKAHGRNAFQTYGPEFMAKDLSAYLGKEFKGEYLDKYVLREPKAKMPLYHLVGAVDPILESDVVKKVGDGLPETLPEWIRFNGLTHIKIKLNGSDLNWDVERVLRVDAAATPTQRERGCKTWHYSMDFNEKCPNVQYLVDCLNQVKAKAPAAFERIQYIEQPTNRDLKTPPRQRDARGQQAAAGGDRRIADRPGKPDALARDGLHRRGAEGLQGPEPGGADGGGGAEIQDVPVRAGPDVPGGVADSLGGAGGAHPRGGGDRGQRAAILPGGQQGLGRALPRDLQDYRRHDGNQRVGRRGPGRRAGVRGSIKSGTPLPNRARARARNRER